MGKIITTIFVSVSVFCAITSFGFADDAKPAMDGDKGMAMDKGPMDKDMMGGKGMMMEKGSMMKGMMGKGMMMHEMMEHGMMMDKKVIATSDGGIIVVVGNKIQKYDKDLNLVKEVEIKMDMEQMHHHMMEMMGDKMGSPEGKSSDTNSDAEHQEHH